MKNLILLFALFIGSQTFAQAMGDVTIYSNTGNKFYVILNGVRQNDRAETNVKVTGLTNQWYECKIMSENNNFTIEKNIMVKYDTLVTYAIKEKKGKYKLRWQSETPLGTSTAVKDQTVVSYHSTETPTNTTIQTGEPVDDVRVNNTSTNGNISTTTTTTTTSTTTSDNMGTTTNTDVRTVGDGETVNMNISVNENGLGADVNVNVTGTADPNRTNTSTSTNMNSSTTTTTTTSTNSTGLGSTYEETTTTTTSSSDGLGTTYYEETTTTTTSSSSGTFGTTTNTSNDGNTMYKDEDMNVSFNNNSCYISDSEVDGIAKQISNESFSDDQARIGNMAAENKCMTADQISKIAKSYTFEDNKLTFLKKAYNNCTDKGNYYKVMETLTFSDDKEELQNYINSSK